MKLLIDQNLAPRLVQLLGPSFDGSVHVRDLGLSQADDRQIWEHAKADGYIILSKDDDFHQRGLVLGHPPKVIWGQLGNASTREVCEAVLKFQSSIEEFAASPEESVMVIRSVGSLRS